MPNSLVNEIEVSKPIEAVGKIFVGDYSKSQEYINELQALLNERSIQFIPNKIMGVYYDNPAEKKSAELKSFQGVFLINEKENTDSDFTKLSLKGKYVHTKLAGDPIKSIHQGYEAIFSYVQQNNIHLKSGTGYQVSTFENGIITTQIYMEII